MRSTVLSAVLFAALLLPFATQAQGPGPGIIPGDILIMLTPEGKASTVANDLRSLGGVATGMRVDGEVSAPMRIWLLKFDHTAVAQERMLAAVKRHPMVMLAQNDHPVEERQVPNDPQYGQQWHHQNIGSETAWDYSTGGLTATGDTIVVCVIEGANTQHADLSANRWFNHAEIPNNGIDDDGNGYVDDFRGWNPGGNNDNVYNGNHGTQVAGMIGAVGDNGVNGVGANWNVKIMVVTYASTSQANVIAAYTYPLVMRRRYNASNGQEGAFVVATNASWGINNGNPASYPLWCAIYDTLGTAGVLNCGATSNSNVNVDVVGDMPTACASDFMVSVTATNVQDNRTFSGYGLTTIDVGAPGDNVFTTTQTSGFGGTSGTSFASPLTAGVIGLLYSAPCPTLMSLVNSDPVAGALYIRQVLFEGVDIVGNLAGQTVTGGRINAGNSMELIMNSCGTCPTPYGGLALPTGNGQAEFTWNALSNGPFNVRYRQVGATDWTEELGVANPSFVANILDPCIAYEFQVEMLCEDESSGYSNSTLLNPTVTPVPVVSIAGRALACASENVELTSSASDNIQWSNGLTDQTITVTQSGTYIVTVTGPCNTATSTPVEITIVTPLPPTAENVVLPGPGPADLLAEGDSILWYDVPVGGTPVATGNNWQTDPLPSSTSFWASSVTESETVTAFGGRAAQATPGQFHTNASFWLLFTANEAFTIRSVKVYANGAGNRPIGLVNATSGATIAQGNFALPNGESRVQLDFNVPGPGNYALRIMSGDPQLWRDGIGSNPAYPYALGTLGAITSSSATGNNALALYYFFYDWEVESFGIACESERVEVTVSMPVGVDDIGHAGGIALYPNPVDDALTVELSGAASGQRMVLQVLDNTGHLVAERLITNDRTVLETGSFASGLYLYRLVDASGAALGTGRFVVAH
jgi:hypothetical protein